jgi:hypothetical protein
MSVPCSVGVRVLCKKSLQIFDGSIDTNGRLDPTSRNLWRGRPPKKSLPRYIDRRQTRNKLPESRVNISSTRHKPLSFTSIVARSEKAEHTPSGSGTKTLNPKYKKYQNTDLPIIINKSQTGHFVDKSSKASNMQVLLVIDSRVVDGVVT